MPRLRHPENRGRHVMVYLYPEDDEAIARLQKLLGMRGASAVVRAALHLMDDQLQKATQHEPPDHHRD